MSRAGQLVDDYSVRPLAIAFDFPEDQIRLLLVWLSMLPVGWFLHFCVRGAKLRHAVNLTVGMLGMTYFYGFAVLHVFAMSGVSYLIMLLAPRDSQQKYVTAFVFAHLSLSHVGTVIYHFDSYDLEITTNTMLLTLRMQAMAWSYYDGGLKRDALTERQVRMKIDQLPNLVEFLSYTFYCQQYALGVFFEYRDFISWIEERDEYRHVPSPVLESLKYAAYSVACIGIYSVGGSYFPIEHCYTDEFAASSMAYKIVFASLAGMFNRFFYYTAFLFQTGTAIASGLGYNGRKEIGATDAVDPKNPDKKGEHQWDKIVGV